MSNLHIYIDGSWLFKACAKGAALSNRLEVSQNFRPNFSRLCDAMLKYASSYDSDCTCIGEKYLSTSIFNIPETVDDWIDGESITEEDIASIRSSVTAREFFANSALSAGFEPSVIFHPFLKDWMIPKLRAKRFQEKQVDATVVALLVRSAITNVGDYHVVITGDADILPAIKVAYPEYSTNVFIATTHPDQLKSEARQSSFALSDFNCNIEPFYLDQHVDAFLDGENVYTCGHCNKVFVRTKSIPANVKPCCHPCYSSRT
ncbi:MAG: hypothetical protein JXR76_14745 [Deltaproteobacteria bacterium]|nr:hypothetical protein [Deltaproteobacteria bacterium]